MTLQVEHDFILQAERETFIEQMKDVMDKAEDMLSEDTDVDRGSDPGVSPPHLSTCGLGTGEVSPGRARLLEDLQVTRLWVRWPGGWALAARGGSTGLPRPLGWPRWALREVLVPHGLLMSAPLPPRRVASPKQTPPCISRTVRLPSGPAPAILTDLWKRHFCPCPFSVSWVFDKTVLSTS